MKTYYNKAGIFAAKLNGLMGATLLLLYSCILFACVGGGVSGTPVTLSSIAVTPTNPITPRGTTKQFTATGTYSDGSTHDITTLVTWSSSNPTVATISNAVGSNGLATPVTEGAVVVSASLNDKTANTNLTVSGWVNVGSPGFSVGEAVDTSLAIDSSGMPYVAYRDDENGFKATVMKFNGESWVNVGSPGFSVGEASYISLAIDSSGMPYVAYQDVGNSYKATVMKFFQ